MSEIFFFPLCKSKHFVRREVEVLGLNSLISNNWLGHVSKDNGAMFCIKCSWKQICIRKFFVILQLISSHTSLFLHLNSRKTHVLVKFIRSKSRGKLLLEKCPPFWSLPIETFLTLTGLYFFNEYRISYTNVLFGMFA